MYEHCFAKLNYIFYAIIKSSNSSDKKITLKLNKWIQFIKLIKLFSFKVPTWLRICNGNVVELLHAIDVGNSDGKTAADICKVNKPSANCLYSLKNVIC